MYVEVLNTIALAQGHVIKKEERIKVEISREVIKVPEICFQIWTP